MINMTNEDLSPHFNELVKMINSLNYLNFMLKCPIYNYVYFIKPRIYNYLYFIKAKKVLSFPNYHENRPGSHSHTVTVGISKIVAHTQ